MSHSQLNKVRDRGVAILSTVVQEGRSGHEAGNYLATQSKLKVCFILCL